MLIEHSPFVNVKVDGQADRGMDRWLEMPEMLILIKFQLYKYGDKSSSYHKYSASRSNSLRLPCLLLDSNSIASALSKCYHGM